jgi:hypothetical protein
MVGVMEFGGSLSITVSRREKHGERTFWTAYVNYFAFYSGNADSDFSSVNDRDRKRMKNRSDRSLDPSRA